MYGKDGPRWSVSLKIRFTRTWQIFWRDSRACHKHTCCVFVEM